MSDEPLLQVRGLRTSFFLKKSTVRAVEDVSFDIRRGEMFGLAGESGSGKSVTALSIMRLLDPSARVVSGEILFEGTDLLRLPEAAMHRIRGDRIAMIFQDPMTSLNPVFTIGDQIAETVMTHRGVSRQDALRQARDLLDMVGIPDPGRRLLTYPHQLSGGMRQRVMIAMAVALRPALLVADEPTTALDVTVQQQILDLLRQLCTELGMAALLVTHNLAVVAENCQRVAIMYAGELVEIAETKTLFRAPLHPYTRALLRSVPRGHISEGRLESIAGQPPVLLGPMAGCHFAPRCPIAVDPCRTEGQCLSEIEPGHWVRCGLAQRPPAEHSAALRAHA